ncbi:hypothetical protein EW146_g4314 [Bondarzewia mesenterica]|uniref:Uncharacterized protein n=1 Tax=Bondarzewia mesenterica TaxID=1095465 RepID=A0A4S4LW17_9AGAM|nr:hypothetical protein EW146_g4314 [Bondarzewia mesenterica]
MFASIAAIAIPVLALLQAVPASAAPTPLAIFPGLTLNRTFPDFLPHSVLPVNLNFTGLEPFIKVANDGDAPTKRDPVDLTGIRHTIFEDMDPFNNSIPIISPESLQAIKIASAKREVSESLQARDLASFLRKIFEEVNGPFSRSALSGRSSSNSVSKRELQSIAARSLSDFLRSLNITIADHGPIANLPVVSSDEATSP